MIIKDSYNGKSCKLALNAQSYASDSPDKSKRGSGLRRQARQVRAGYAVNAAEILGDSSDASGLYFLSDGVGTLAWALFSQTKRWQTFFSSPDAENGCLFVFALDKGIYLADVSGSGLFENERVVKQNKYGDIVREHLKSKKTPIFVLPSNGKASEMAKTIDLGDRSRGSFSFVMDDEEIDFKSKDHTTSRLWMLMLKEGYYHPVYLIPVVLGVGIFYSYTYYTDYQEQIAQSLLLAAQERSKKADVVDKKIVDFSGAQVLIGYGTLLDEFIDHGLRRDAMVALDYQAGRAEAKGALSVAGYPHRAKILSDARSGYRLMTGTTDKGWSLSAPLITEDRVSSVIEWDEFNVKSRLFDVAIATDHGFTIERESDVAADVFEFTFSYKSADSTPATLHLLADYLNNMPVGIDTIRCTFGKIEDPVDCTVIGKASFYHGGNG